MVLTIARGLQIDHGRRIVHVDGTPVELTATEFDVLACLQEASPNVVSVGQLGREVWGLDTYFDKRALEVTVSRLRKKLGDEATDPRFISTVRGIGYCMRSEQQHQLVATLLYDSDLNLVESWAADWVVFGVMPDGPSSSDWMPPFQFAQMRDRHWMRSLVDQLFAMGLRHTSGLLLLEERFRGAAELWIETQFLGQAEQFNGLLHKVLARHAG